MLRPHQNALDTLVNAKDCGLTLLQSYLFEFILEIVEFHLVYWSEFNNWLVWRMHPPLCFAPGGKMNILIKAHIAFGFRPSFG